MSRTATGVSRATTSSTVAVGTATICVIAAVAVGFLGNDRPGLGCAAWTLRGSLVPDTPKADVARLASPVSPAAPRAP